MDKPSINIHRSGERGTADYGWLKTNYSFSFADYYNPERMGFGKLRVLNDDTVGPNKGFGMHPHDNMEIVTIVLDGELRHKDDMGNEGIIRKGEVQRMSAGTGLVHSEFNNLPKNDVRLLQIWVEPKKRDIKPGYEQKKFSLTKNKIAVLVSPDDKDALHINQDAVFSRAILEKRKNAEYKVSRKGSGVFVFVINGETEIEGKKLSVRDSIEITGKERIGIAPVSDCDILIIEVPMEV